MGTAGLRTKLTLRVRRRVRKPRGELYDPAMVERMDFKRYMADMFARNAPKIGLNGVYAVSLHGFPRNFTSGFGVKLPGCGRPAYVNCAQIDKITYYTNNKTFACDGRDGTWVYIPELFDTSASLICDAPAPALKFIRARLPEYEPENIPNIMDFVEIWLLTNWS